MDDRPIGIFDSGVGGLTSINAFSEVLPNESIVYFGDTARAPYGNKSPRTVRAFSGEIADFLVNITTANSTLPIGGFGVSASDGNLPLRAGPGRGAGTAGVRAAFPQRLCE